MSSHCSSDLSVAEFFRDSPWLDVPKERIGEILVEPLYARRGLLGGTSKQDGAPKSKLAALVATRKNKENQRPEDGRISTNSVALLDKLAVTSRESKMNQGPDTSVPSRQSQTTERAAKVRNRQYHARKPQDTSVLKPPQEVSSIIEMPPPRPSVESQPEGVPAATPSVFAQIMLGLISKAESVEPQSLDQHAVRAFVNCTEFNFAGPSPDDVVLEAQTSKSQPSKIIKQTPKTKNDDNSINDVAQGIKGVTVEEQKVKRKNLDVLAEFEKSKSKNAANFVVIGMSKKNTLTYYSDSRSLGHVDAGKSTLMGRLLHDLNVVDKRTIDKYRKEADRLGKSSFALAWVLDQGTEERERGVTIDIAMNKFETDRTSFTILDAPGHRDFIPNMIAGASQADFAVLVIDASTGNFESGLKGQTKEHALLVRSIGVQRVVVAINKLDTVQWSQDRFDEIAQQVSAFLTSAGFLSKNLAFVPCAGLTGENIVRKSEDAKASWYTGPSLISLLESSEPIARALEKPLRVTIDDMFRGGVQNPLSISGRVDAGSTQIGDIIQVMPANQTAIIKGLEVDSEPADWAVAGQNVVLHLTGIEAKYLKSGDVICLPSAPVRCITSFIVKILAFEHITPMHCEVLKGRLLAASRVTKLVAQLDKASGAVLKGKKPRLVKPGTVARIVIEVDDPIPLEQGDRVIIRAGGETMGAGLVE